MFGLLGSSLRTLGAILGAALAALVDTEAVKSAADDMVTNTRQVLHTTAANQNDAVFLKIVAFTSDIGDDFKAVGQAHLGNFTKSGVRLLRSCCVNTGADTAFLRAVVERRALALFNSSLARLTH